MSSDIWSFTGDSGGHTRTSWLHAGKFINKLLARELADLWSRHARASGWSYGTASHAAMGIRRFVRFVDDMHPSGHMSLTGPGDRCGAALLAWRKSLRENRETDKWWRHVVVLLKRAHFEELGLQPTLALTATQAGWSFKSATTETPLEEYSNAERLDQTRIATDDVAKCEERVRRGSSLYLNDARFRELIAYAQTESQWSAIVQVVRSDDQLLNRIEVALESRLPDSAGDVVRAIGSLIAPTPLELISFQVLLQWDTGLAPEQVRDTRTDQITLGESSLYWISPKSRSRRVMKMNFDGREPWTTVGLMKRVVRATTLARTIAKTERVFTTYTVAPRSTGAMLFKPMPHPSPTLADWFKEHKTKSSEPHDLRRIRKAHKAVRIGVLSTAEEAASPDHTIDTLGRYYSHSATSLQRSGRVVTLAQGRVLERSLDRRARVVVAAAADVARDDTSDNQRLAAEVAERSAAERSLTASACSDPLASPYAEAGEWCLKAPVACLLCPNAVIFADHAPQLLLIRRALMDRRSSVRPDEYAADVHPYVAAAEDYIAQLAPDVVRAASESIERGSEYLNLPLQQRVQS